MKSWHDNFITQHNPQVKRYTAWDETAAYEIGTFDTYKEAKQALNKYAKDLDLKLRRVKEVTKNEHRNKY